MVEQTEKNLVQPTAQSIAYQIPVELPNVFHLLEGVDLTEPAELFDTLRKKRFSGQVIIRQEQGQGWTFFLYLGRLIYGTGGGYPVRRWRRSLRVYCPDLPNHFDNVEQELTEIARENLGVCWEYQLLQRWVQRKYIAPEQVSSMILAVVTEVFFEVLQNKKFIYRVVNRDNDLPYQLTLINPEVALGKAGALWEEWEKAGLALWSPNLAPVIQQSEQLQAIISPGAYRALSRLLDGQRRFWDLAAKMQQTVGSVARSLQPYVENETLGLVEIPDLPLPVPLRKSPHNPRF